MRFELHGWLLQFFQCRVAMGRGMSASQGLDAGEDCRRCA